MRKVCGIFGQILRFIPRPVFESAVREHQTEKHAKGMTSWSQFIELLFSIWAEPGSYARSWEDWRRAKVS